MKRCSWRALKVARANSKRPVPPDTKRKVLQHWAEFGGESPRGFAVIIPPGAHVIDMAGFWPGDER